MERQSMQDATQHAPVMSEVIAGLNDLLMLDHDAIAAYGVAIQKLEDVDLADQIAGFQRDHQRHIEDLNEEIHRLGGVAENKPHATGRAKEALQKLGGVAGDKGVLIAWRANELQVRTKYDSYASRAAFWPNEVKRLIDRNALDEERHYEWVVTTLNGMGIGPDDHLETGLANRIREAGTRAEVAVERTRERVTETAATAKNRVADSLETAAERVEKLEEGRDMGPRAEAATHRVADGMRSGAGYIRRSDLHSARTDLERSARQHPFRTVATMFAVGFVLGRILR